MNRYDTPVLLQRADPYILLAEDLIGLSFGGQGALRDLPLCSRK